MSDKCQFCSYDKNVRVLHLCGFCEEEAIRQRIKWWQEGKKKLNEKDNEKTRPS